MTRLPISPRPGDWSASRTGWIWRRGAVWPSSWPTFTRIRVHGLQAGEDLEAAVRRQRVAAYVIRQRGRRSELLVFEQAGTPEAGTQIPAGGIVAGETAEGAVVREIAEEAGLIGVTVRARLHTEDKPH
ncbi:NUDIX domain-containing protein [Mycobacterium hodleri]|nr:NUDIX domain-containing protein [Mycolicibacterium hodleri]